MTRKELAMSYFEEGYNCSQSVLLAFQDCTDIDVEYLAKIASSFGGGIGRMREVCGAVSGMCMACGLISGYSDPKAQTEKSEHYARIRALADEFKARNGSIICRELLGLEKKEESSEPTPRTPEFYHKRPCKELVGMAAEILENSLKEKAEVL